jgi:hypothetical protein
MSIFGQLDAANIPANPYWIEEGEYPAQVTKAYYKTKPDGDRQLIIVYTINDENSQFNGKPATQFFNLVAEDMTAEKFELLPADEKQRIHNTNAAIKRTLCGNPANTSQRGLGVDQEELNDDSWQPESLVNKNVIIGISNFGKENQGVNVRWVNLNEE